METDHVLRPNTVRNRPSFVEQELVDIFALRAFVFPSATLAKPMEHRADWFVFQRSSGALAFTTTLRTVTAVMN